MADNFYKGENWLKPLVMAWREKKQAADKARSSWLEVARQCRRFYAGGASWMWDNQYRRKVWGGDPPTPTWKLSVNKCFEFVSIYMPYLWSNMPHRHVEPKRQMDFAPELLFGPPPQPPPQMQQMMQQAQQQGQQNPQLMAQAQMMQQQFQMQAQQYQQQVGQYQQKQHLEKQKDEARADLMKRWLNYTTREMPHGGLQKHGELCCLDTLITGRGVLWPAPYRMPGSERTLTGCFWRPVTDFFTDPDYDTWENGTYVMRETTEDVAKVEKRFQLPPGSLRNRGSFESNRSMAERATDYRSGTDRDQGRTKDRMTYTEVWSKAGVGCRWTAIEPKLRDYLDKTVGQYAYLAWSDDVPWPLNAPIDAFNRKSSDEEIKRMFEWDVPYWADNKWPCTVQDFYHDIPLKEEGDERNDRTKFKGWPIAPMGPGLGELKFINAALSFLTNRIVSSCRDFWAVMKPALSELKDALESGNDQQIIPVNKIHGKISDIVQIIQQPETRGDVWKIIDAMLVMLDKRWHLNSLMYGMSGPTQERSATEVVEKRQAMQLVPEFMAKKVEATQTEAAVQEAFCTVFFVKANDVLPLMGEAGAWLWQQLIESQDPEIMLRQMRYLIGAGTIRRTNRDKQAADLNSMMQAYMPLLQGYFQATGDVEAINATIDKHGEVSEADFSDIKLKPPPPPQPDPAEQQKMQLEQQKMQMEIQKLQMEMQGKQMEIQGKQADAQAKQQQAQVKMAADSQKLQMDRAAAAMDLQQDQASHSQDLIQDRRQHVQELLQSSQLHEQKLNQLEAESAVKVKTMRAQAKAKPQSTNGNGRT